MYNVERYLGKCIESILGQTYRDFELILVDDGSTDSSGKICDSYQGKDARIHVIHKDNAGVSVARNMGIEQARGEYICFIDSDDWIESNYLSEIKNEIADFDILFFGCFLRYEDGMTGSICPPAVECRTDIGNVISYLFQNDMQINYFGYPWNSIYRREIIDRFGIRFLETLSYCEDEVFNLAYCNHACSLKIITPLLYNYRMKEQGLTHMKKTPEVWYMLVDSYVDLLDGIKSQALVECYKMRIAGYYNLAAWASTNPFVWIKWEWRTINYCRDNKLHVPTKEILKGGLNKIKQVCNCIHRHA